MDGRENKFKPVVLLFTVTWAVGTKMPEGCSMQTDNADCPWGCTLLTTQYKYYLLDQTLDCAK